MCFSVLFGGVSVLGCAVCSVFHMGLHGQAFIFFILMADSCIVVFE